MLEDTIGKFRRGIVRASVVVAEWLKLPRVEDTARATFPGMLRLDRLVKS